MTLDLRLVRKAQALAQHGSFSRAAEALRIAQPTLSRSIKELEEAVGLPLFTRHRHGADPTDFGKVFLQQAALVLAQLGDLEREVALAKGLQTGELAVGFGPYAAELLAAPALAHFASHHPGVRLRIQVDSLEPLGRALRLRALDLVVGETTILENDEAIEILERLAPIAGHFIARAGHPLAARTDLTLQDVLDYPLVQVGRLPTRALKPLLAARRPSRAADRPAIPVPAIECPSVPMGVRAVLGSNALMIASLGMVKAELESALLVPILHQPWMRTDWAIMSLAKRSLGPAASAFAAQLRTSHLRAVAENEGLLTQPWSAATSDAPRRAATRVQRAGSR